MLSVIDGRVLGTLMEKELTTPDQYPLSANGLVLGCNQATNRHPVMQVSAAEVDESVLRLKALHLARVVHPTHGRGVTKYRHVAGETLGLDGAESAVLGVLLLRGPQTAGELRTRTERLHGFENAGAVEQVLRMLQDRDEPLVQLLDRQPGHKEPRWMQLVAAEMPVTPVSSTEPSAEPPASIGAPAAAPTSAAAVPSPTSAVAEHVEPGLIDRVADLEARIARLESALADLLDEPAT